MLIQNAKTLSKRKDSIRFLADAGGKHVVQDPKNETFIVGDSTLRVAHGAEWSCLQFESFSWPFRRQAW